MVGGVRQINSAAAETAPAKRLSSACSADLLSSSRLLKSFVAATVYFCLPLSLRYNLLLKRSMGAHRMFGKMTVVVLAKSQKKRGARIQNRGQ